MPDTQLDTPTGQRTLAYILAPSYTGSTLLTFLLAQHKDVATIGELKASARGDLSTYRCSCGTLQLECGFWKQVSEEMKKLDASFTLEEFGTHFRTERWLSDRLLRARVRCAPFELARASMLGLLPDSRRRLRDILERNRQIIEVICSLQQANVFLDGSKDPIRLKHLHASGIWNVKVIYLIRDGRGATNSYMRHYDVSMEVAAREWCRTHRECDQVVRQLSNNALMTIHYEDVCTATEEVLRSIHAFLEIDSEGDGLRCRGGSDCHVLGNEMRLRSPGEVRLDEKWKRALPKRDLRTFVRIAGGLNGSYGYI